MQYATHWMHLHAIGGLENVVIVGSEKDLLECLNRKHRASLRQAPEHYKPPIF
jgi:hypothetical protein